AAERGRADLFAAGQLGAQLCPAGARAVVLPGRADARVVDVAADQRDAAVGGQRDAAAADVPRADLFGAAEPGARPAPRRAGARERPNAADGGGGGPGADGREVAVGGQRDGVAQLPAAGLAAAGELGPLLRPRRAGAREHPRGADFVVVVAAADQRRVAV